MSISSAIKMAFNQVKASFNPSSSSTIATQAEENSVPKQQPEGQQLPADEKAAQPTAEAVVATEEGQVPATAEEKAAEEAVPEKEEKDAEEEKEATDSIHGHTVIDSGQVGEVNHGFDTEHLATPIPEEAVQRLGLRGADDLRANIPTASITGSPVVAEGGYAIFTINLDNESNFTHTVNVTATNGTAIGGAIEPADYLNTTLQYSADNGTTWTVFTNGSAVTIPANVTSNALLVRVQTLDDAGNPIYEGPESFNIALSDAGDAVLLVDTTAAVGTITDFEVPNHDQPTASIVGSPVVAEGEYAEFTINLDKESNIEHQVNVTVTNGSATGGVAEPADYINATLEYYDSGTSSWVSFSNGGTVTIPANVTAGALLVRVQTLDDVGNPIYEGPESFNIALSDAGDTVLLVDTTAAVGTITDFEVPNHDQPTASIVGSPVVAEGEPAEFIINLDKESNFTHEVNVTVTNGTATGGVAEPADYIDATLEYYDSGTSSWVSFSNGGTVTIPANVTAGALLVRVQTLDDSGNPIYEGHENFSIALSSAGDAVLLVDTIAAVGTITDAEDIPTVSISDGDPNPQTEGTGAQITFTVSLTNPADEDTEVT
ncbi:MAG: hypothetical protein KAT71_05725, partial [Gammaproteobacteria bacterium]|nr:hypothetical protein [Gammaproteobacteria bacterium]